MLRSLSAALLTSVALVSLAAPASAAPAQDPVVIAHRGGADLAPQNSMKAFRKALTSTPAAEVETDLLLTRDGVAVLSHDDTLPSRCTSAGKKVHELSWVQLAKVRCSGEPIPKASELAALMADHPDKRLLMEIKTWKGQSVSSMRASVQTWAKVARSAGIENRTTVQSFRWRELTGEIHKTMPRGRIGALETTPTFAAIREADRLGVDDFTTYQPNTPQVMVDYVRSRGMRPGVWGTDDRIEYARASAMHIGATITDDPVAVSRGAVTCASRTSASNIVLLNRALTVGRRQYPAVVGTVTPTAEALTDMTVKVVISRGRGTGVIDIAPQGSSVGRAGVRIAVPKGSKTVTVRVSPGDKGRLRVFTTKSTATVKVTAVGVTRTSCSTR